MRYSRSFFKK